MSRVGRLAALGIALMLNRPFRGRTVVRLLALLPWAVPSVVNGIMWKWILNPSYGAANGLLYQLGIIDAAPQSQQIAERTGIVEDVYVVPAFAVGRTQKLLFMLRELQRTLCRRVPVRDPHP